MTGAPGKRVATWDGRGPQPEMQARVSSNLGTRVTTVHLTRYNLVRNQTIRRNRGDRKRSQKNARLLCDHSALRGSIRS
jgi:hypothetical protein